MERPMPEARIEIAADEGCIDALVVQPSAGGWRPPVILLAGGRGAGAGLEVVARRLAARGYFVLAPDWRARPPSERRADAEAWLDYLAGERSVDDARVGV